MNVFELLISDHRAVSSLFEQIESDDNLAMQENLFARIRQSLNIHMEIEETYFYPYLQKHFETEYLTLEAVEEHNDIRDLIEQLDEISPTDEDWGDSLRVLKNAVGRHVDAEEGELFAKTREVLSEDTLRQLGEALQKGLQQIRRVVI